MQTALFYVIKNEKGNLLGKETAILLDALLIGLNMAMATNFVTLGELWSSHVEMEEEDEAIFSRIKVLIENHLPDGWRDWKVIDWKKEDLFGKKIDHKVLNKIRFALPTLELVKAFYPEATSVGEKTYRNIKLRLLNWNLCRALIMSPRQVACQL
ncbi:unnamed protein product [Acanthoscelides obtectus]|uniref:Uncharacterized protein n=1 Tax=Acanthoscelides obtectus TaxID=200917 RepID=A0A9P0MJJ1_ACAOB|nr:unnamed protein product [Acanthoscelides obtectus]CAK1669277.1 hypothetical protein AOBTE_LOCUS26919 [Acanthoscelides obtectus]